MVTSHWFDIGSTLLFISVTHSVVFVGKNFLGQVKKALKLWTLATLALNF
ncbi:hypothetical protein VCRA2119O240_330050 [Vibrio crassostreae]|nr:hypothetical protein VCRA2113O204_310011 [Vibrio crassostreae]CAK2047859.1 hypothetical protein VCRA2110O177_320053 [Vibrio crassostreae]CAK2048277.1 hypothetical protein VCRA2112O189_310052 [Vibrio crassostreae]CAK2049585.1 hypothetical protein VCRA2113O198_330053 [Vibrio crassostreae]CAK2049936.1 hypothetical protein VCRA2110O180_330052 [Vibrio crassostreae]